LRASLALVSSCVVRAIRQQLGGEPEYARPIARTKADGGLSMALCLKLYWRRGLDE
jgi:methyl-accepting chemotaxis protein